MTTERAKRSQLIQDKFARFITNIELSNKRNRTDINLDAEDLICSLLNILWSTNLENINKQDPYSAGIDLWDQDKKLFVQVSSDGSKSKIESALQTCSKRHQNGTFRFICLQTSHRVCHNITVPEGITYDPSKDFYDINKLLTEIDSNDDTLDEVYAFLKTELYPEDMGRLTSDLGNIIRALTENPEIDQTKLSLITPELQSKVELNGLTDMQDEIEEWASFFGLLEQVYRQFPNSIRAVAQSRVTRSYIQQKNTGKHGIALFYAISDELRDIIISHNDLSGLSYERIEYGLHIVMTDIFMQCRIFEKTRQQEEK